MLLMAICWPWHANAQETLTVCNGSTTSTNAPIRTGSGSQSEIIYPARLLGDMAGGSISSVKFFASTTSTSYTNTVTVYVQEVSDTIENTSAWQYNQSSATKVYEGTSLSVTSSGELLIEFSSPYEYAGGNLCFNIWCVTSAPSVTFYGIDPDNASCGYDYYITPPVNKPWKTEEFLPKAEFTYESADVSCTKPKSFNATGITAHTATLTWTAGDEESNWDVYLTTDGSVVPDEETTPTCQVTSCSKDLSGLTAQTTYYAYVRANCGGGDGVSKWAKKVFSTTREALSVDSEHPYSQNFETSNDWGFTNGDLTNKWCYGTATNNGGSKAMYVSNDSGTTNAYTLNSTTVVFASKLLAFANGTYTITFDWKADGESNSAGTTHYDYMRAALAPGDVEFTAGTSLPSGVSASALPSGWIALDGGHQLNKSAEWQSQSAEVAANGTYTMVFIWRNDSGSGNQPPAAIDNISISATLYPRPTGLAANSVAGRTATITWTENGTATNWVLQYATNSSFSENLESFNVSGTPSKDLSGLTPETKYYIRVKSVIGGDESSWSDVQSFTTTATCLPPSSLSATKTSTTITLSWTAGEVGQDAWDIRYKTGSNAYTYIHLNDHSATSHTITGLSPVTTYSVNVRAYCDSDDQSKWGYNVNNQNSDLSVTTECGALTLPYVCDFEDVALETSPSSSYPYPKCWTRNHYRGGYEGSYTYYPSIRSASYSYPYAHAGNGENATSGKSMHFYKPYTSTDESVVLPEIDSQYDIAGLQISFWARLESYQTNKALYIGVMTDPSDIATFTVVDTVTVANDSFQEYIAYFGGYSGEGRYIAIRYSSSTSGYIFVDDITVDVVPTCVAPSDMEVVETGLTTASLTWTEGIDETEWNIQYKKSIASDWSESIHVTELPTALDPFVLTDLKRGTEYDVRIQSYCDADDQSHWISTPVSFTTDCGTWPIDADNALVETFSESTFPPGCWDWIRIDNYYGWQLNTNVYNPIDVSGTAYSYWPSGDTYLILPQMHIDGGAKMTFDMAFSSSGSGETSSVVLSTTGKAAINFATTLWTAASFPTSTTKVEIDLSDYDDQDIYIAFKYAGVGTEGRTWYIDNVMVYCSVYSLCIEGYDGGDSGRWHLISSPLTGTTDVSDVQNLTSNVFDLYRFNQSAALEWENWKNDASTHYHFGLESGRGYLYANDNDVSLNFIGTAYGGTGNVTLHWDEDAVLAGWNLIGNPFAAPATLDEEFYRMNDEGNGFIAADDDAVGMMEGILVYTETDGAVVTFVKDLSKNSAKEQIVLNLQRERGVDIDRVIVRFGDGSTLPKYSLSDNTATIAVRQNGADYAVVRGVGAGEMPVSFKTETLGKYTLKASVMTADVNYLHLIDKFTDDDIDLLLEDSYSFMGSPSDEADRFTLRFSANITGDGNDAFAYQNDGEIVVKGDGMLQVFDIMGRMVDSRQIHAVETICTSSMPTGVYVLRIVGDNVKTQKIVVR